MRLRSPSETSDEDTSSLKPTEATITLWRLNQRIRALPLLARLQILFWWLTENLAMFEFTYCEEVRVLFYFFILVSDICLIHGLSLFQFLYFTEDLPGPERMQIHRQYRLLKGNSKNMMMKEVHQHLVSTSFFFSPS